MVKISFMQFDLLVLNVLERRQDDCFKMRRAVSVNDGVDVFYMAFLFLVKLEPNEYVVGSMVFLSHKGEVVNQSRIASCFCCRKKWLELGDLGLRNREFCNSVSWDCLTSCLINYLLVSQQKFSVDYLFENPNYHELDLLY